MRTFEPEQWRVVSARVDGCARDRIASSCEHQLRLVCQPWSPVLKAFEDEALHLIFGFDEAELTGLVSEWFEAIASQTPRPPADLGVHPTIEATGNRGAFGLAIQQVIRHQATPARLRRVAISQGAGLGFNWPFIAFDRRPVGLQLVPLSCLPPNTMQEVLNDLPSAPLGAYGILPGPTCTDELQVLAQGTYSTAGAQIQGRTTDAALRILNPALLATGEVDCASCHIASRRLAQARGTPFLTAVDGHPSRYRPSTSAPLGLSRAGDVADSTPRGSYKVRAFGYQFTLHAVSYRTILDSERVLADLRARFP
jgi:hypothetical protein